MITTARATRYTVSALPEDHPDSDMFEIAVEYRGDGLWGVRHLGYSLSATGQWSPGPSTDDGREAWFAAHRFTKEAALAAAHDAAPKLTVNGFTAAQVLARTEATR